MAPRTRSQDRILEIFRSNGYMRFPKMERRKEEKTNYKKGWEVRIIVKSEAELREASRLLRRAGFRAGKPFRKVNRWAQPVYGKKAVEFFSGKRATTK